MARIREVISDHIGIVAGLLGVLSLLLLDMPFIVMTGGPYGTITLCSGLQMALEGTNLNPAETVWESYPSQVYSSIPLPGAGFIPLLFVLLVFIIIGGALVVQVAGLTTAVLHDKDQRVSAGKLIEAGGGLIAFIALISIIGILMTFTELYRYGSYGTSVMPLPGWAVFAELIVGLVVAYLGFRLHSSLL